MPERALQVAFEIKTACDEISRRLLRWHWERKPGAHSLDALLEHIAARKQESPDYYDRMPDLTGKTSWQQLDTTLCMRVLLDPEKDAAKPLDLLGNTRHIPLPPAMPATPSAPPATRQPMRQLLRTAHRQPCCSTKPSGRWRRATPVLPLRKTNWRSITARQRTT